MHSSWKSMGVLWKLAKFFWRGYSGLFFRVLLNFYATILQTLPPPTPMPPSPRVHLWWFDRFILKCAIRMPDVHDLPHFARNGRISWCRFRRHLEVWIGFVEKRFPSSRKVLKNETRTRTLECIAARTRPILDVEAEIIKHEV